MILIAGSSGYGTYGYGTYGGDPDLNQAGK